MPSHTSSTTLSESDYHFTCDEIRNELANLGLTDLPNDQLCQLKQQLDDIITHERQHVSSGSSTTSTTSVCLSVQSLSDSSDTSQLCEVPQGGWHSSAHSRSVLPLLQNSIQTNKQLGFSSTPRSRGCDGKQRTTLYLSHVQQSDVHESNHSTGSSLSDRLSFQSSARSDNTTTTISPVPMTMNLALNGTGRIATCSVGHGDMPKSTSSVKHGHRIEGQRSKTAETQSVRMKPRMIRFGSPTALLTSGLISSRTIGAHPASSLHCSAWPDSYSVKSTSACVRPTSTSTMSDSQKCCTTRCDSHHLKWTVADTNQSRTTLNTDARRTKPPHNCALSHHRHDDAPYSQSQSRSSSYGYGKPPINIRIPTQDDRFSRSKPSMSCRPSPCANLAKTGKMVFYPDLDVFKSNAHKSSGYSPSDGNPNTATTPTCGKHVDTIDFDFAHQWNGSRPRSARFAKDPVSQIHDIHFRNPGAKLRVSTTEQPSEKRSKVSSSHRIISYPVQRRRHDPVARFHLYQRNWLTHLVPGEDARRILRWNIKTAMMHREVPLLQRNYAEVVQLLGGNAAAVVSQARERNLKALQLDYLRPARSRPCSAFHARNV